MSALTSAGSPPDDGHEGPRIADAGGDITDTGPAITPVEPLGESDSTLEVADAISDFRSSQVAPQLAPYTPTTTELTSQLLPAVQRGFSLAQRGALYAARTEFVQVLRRIAQAHDAAAGTSEHSRALADGLRALDEAEDFVPDGVQLEGELDVRKVASSHRTGVLPGEPADVSSFEAVALYHAFAQQELKVAVAGEQAGSMALHGLGTTYARLAARGDDDVQLTRSAMTMYSAAVASCPNNHLAANELGVLICRSGRAAEAATLFEQTIDVAPSALAYHNLAMAQRKLGLHGHAAANEFESQRLASLERARGEVSRRAGVRWVSPDEMARAGQPSVQTPATTSQSATRVGQPVQTGILRKWR
jgi:tetratricopeptide (TPR) repeat protein